MTNVIAFLSMVGLITMLVLSTKRVIAQVRWFRLRTIGLRVYWLRTCRGRTWRRAFPRATNDEIRQYLRVFTQSFSFDDNQGLLFSPDDEVLQIYRTCYPTAREPDDLELETLVSEIESQYHVDVKPRWHEDITLGDLFRVARGA